MIAVDETVTPDLPDTWGSQHRWAANEDADLLPFGLRDRCLVCRVRRYDRLVELSSLPEERRKRAEATNAAAAGPCPGPPPPGHVTSLSERTTGRHKWLVWAVCSCGWEGPPRAHRVTAEDDTAAHVLEVQS